MRLKNITAGLLLSVACLLPRAGFADTLQFTGTSGQSVDGVYVYPYYLTVTGPGGSNTAVSMSCLNFNREITTGQTWNVNVYSVASIAPSATIDSESGVDILADAYLYNQYAAATGNAQLTSDIQFAIWDIMDPSGVSGESGLDSNARSLASAALSVANGSNLNTSQFKNDYLFVPSGSYSSGEPQDFMASPLPSAITPEPASLLLLGTGVLGFSFLLRREPVNAYA
jgi:hypothetical protein